MSHFTCLVIGDNVEAQLQPFHEFECTGTEDQYVVVVDETEKLREEYTKAKERKLRSPDGTYHNPYDAQFYRDPSEAELIEIGPLAGAGAMAGFSYTSRDWGDGKGYRAKVRYVPDGYEEVEIPVAESQNFREWLKDHYEREEVTEEPTFPVGDDHPCKYGFTLIDAAGEVVKTCDRTNPNAQWDWWQVGGRWTGHFKLKPGRLGQLGEKSLLDSSEPRDPAKVADRAYKGDIDFDAMRAEAREKAAAEYDKFMDALGATPFPETWETVRERHGENIEAAREAYHAQPGVIATRSVVEFGDSVTNYACSRDAYIDRAAKRAGQTFAFIRDGKWYERGDMGWWGVVHDEKPEDTWLDEFNKMLDELPGDVVLTVVDCHI